jgi:hypothetical protein
MDATYMYSAMQKFAEGTDFSAEMACANLRFETNLEVAAPCFV